jgi:hypothetical protein
MQKDLWYIFKDNEQKGKKVKYLDDSIFNSSQMLWFNGFVCVLKIKGRQSAFPLEKYCSEGSEVSKYLQKDFRSIDVLRKLPFSMKCGFDYLKYVH